MTRPVPYPADTRAKGWRFELDYEKVEQSDTWDLATEVPMAQPALLMMWMRAWMQVPCGSMPNDEQQIRVKCRIPVNLWPAFKPILMRGWWLAEDGRLYHDTLVARVLEMLAQRRGDADRQARRRATTGKPHVHVTRDTDKTPPGVQGESATGTGTSNESVPDGTDTADAATKPAPKPPRKRRGAAPPAQLVTVEDLVAAGVKQQHAEDWLTVRAKKNLPLTPTAWADVQTQAEQAGLTVGEAVRQATVNGWGGFKSTWLSRGAGPPDQRTQGARPTKFTAAAADIFPQSPDLEVIDAQARHRH